MVTLSIFFGWFSFITFLCLVATNSAWIYYCFKTNRNKLILLPSISLIIACAIILVIFIDVGLDESEHLHCAWLVSKGLVPYRDFWQHHLPMLWLCLAPLIGKLKPSFAVYIISRDFCILHFIIISLTGWKIAQIAWKGKAKLAVYLLLLFCGGISWEFFWVRPDLFMILFLLLGIYFLLKATEGKNIFFVLIGIIFSLAISFSNKHLLFIILPTIIIFLGQKKSIVLKLTLYISGLIIGCLPLIFYLFKNNIIKEFEDSVFRFNSRYVEMSGDFLLVIGIIGWIGWYLLSKEHQSKRDLKSLVLLIAFILGSVGSLFKMYGVRSYYYLNFWLILCAILGSGCNISNLWERLPFRKIAKSLILGLVLAILIMSTIAPLKRYKFTFWDKDKKVISKLISLCGDETCLTFIPYHPIFAYDATRLYSLWQYIYIELFDKQVREDATRKDIVDEIITSSPVVISCTWDIKDMGKKIITSSQVVTSHTGKIIAYLTKSQKKEVFNSLWLNKLISESGYEKIKTFINQRYTIKEIDGIEFYIRNDIVNKYEWPPELPKNKFNKLREVLGLAPGLPKF